MMPEQKPHRSKQDYQTPRELIVAVERRFEPITIDLAARADNAVISNFIAPEVDSLLVTWPMMGFGWLNPPFDNIDAFAEKCARAIARRGNRFKVALLVPASVGSNWYRDHVIDRALVLGLSPRVKFVGCADCYPKDCIVAVFGERPRQEVWRWRIDDMHARPAVAIPEEHLS